MQQCKIDLQPGGRKFIRSVTFETGNCCILSTDNQLDNVIRFCTNQGASCVLGIDPTFNLGKFYVTVTTYVYSHVINKATHNSPTFLGPILVHTEKTYESYYYFFSTLMKLQPKFANVVAIGTDGEQALVKAIQVAFQGKVIQLRCFIHMKDNIRRYLTEILLPESTREDIIRDIFGHQQGTMYFKGILDADSSDDFDRRLACVKSKWDALEFSAHPERDPKFYSWLLRYEADVMKSSLIASVRESAGLGSPPSVYTTNRNESMNNLAKSYADYHQSSWVQLSHNMFKLVIDQSQEVEKAVIGMGEYRFKPAYQHLNVETTKWFKMSPEQRQKHMKKVNLNELKVEVFSLPF